MTSLSSIPISVASIINNRVNDKGIWENTCGLNPLTHSASRQTSTLCGKVDGLAVMLFKTKKKEWIGSQESSCILADNKLFVYIGKSNQGSSPFKKIADVFLRKLKTLDEESLPACFWNIAFHGKIAQNKNLEETFTKETLRSKIRFFSRNKYFVNPEYKTSKKIAYFNIKNQKYVIGLGKNGLVCQKELDWFETKQTGFYIPLKDRYPTGKIKEHPEFPLEAIDKLIEKLNNMNIFVSR